jgi:hypothetical protein
MPSTSAYQVCAAFRWLVPMPQCLAIGETKLRERVGDVVLDRIGTDTTTFSNCSTRHAMLDRMHHPPFGWRQDVIVRGSAAARGDSHGAMVIRGDSIYPPPRRSPRTSLAVQHLILIVHG